MRYTLTEPSRGAVEDRRRERAKVRRADAVAKTSVALEKTIRNTSTRTLGPELAAEVLEVGERIEQEPWTEAFFLANELAALRKPTPHEDTPSWLGPDGHDAGRGVPTPKPFVL